MHIRAESREKFWDPVIGCWLLGVRIEDRGRCRERLGELLRVN